MAESKYSKDGVGARQVQIQDLLSREGPVAVKDLAVRLHCSEVTIYRDVQRLEAAGVVRLNRGMVIPRRSFLSEAPPALRYEINFELKDRICLAAQELVEPESTLLLDDSSTVLPLLEHLEQKVPLTIITNSQLAARRLENKPGIRLYVTGGLYYQWADAFHGHMAIRALQDVQADYCFISTTGFTARGAADSFDSTAEIKAAMVQASETRVLLADSTKFGRRALHIAARLKDLDVVITDKTPTDPSPEQLESQGIRLILAP